MLKLTAYLEAPTLQTIDQCNMPQGKILLHHSHVLKLLICFLLILITLMAFWQVRNNEFINLDDDLYVTKNHHVQEGLTLKGILWAFTTVHAQNWHPMTWLSHMLAYDFFALNPGGHHMTNLLFHVANTLLLFLLLHQMTTATWQSGFVAALFALHPLHVESVAWVAEHKDVLSAFFWMLTIWTYVRYVERPKLNRYLLVVLCFVLALMSKIMAVTLPFVLLLMDYWPLGRLKFEKSINTSQERFPIFRFILEKAPLFILSALFSSLTMLIQWRAGDVAALSKLPLEIRFENALVSYVKYIAKMIWPDHLAVLYPHPILLPVWEVVGAALLLIIITVLVILTRRRRPYYMVGWLWYLGTLVPVIGLVQVGIQARADRYTYIPLIGLFIMVAYGVPEILMGWRYRRLTLVISGGLLLLLLMITTVLQVQRWRNSVTLFSHTLHVTVNNSLIHNNLGLTLAKQGKDKEAVAHYTRALEINPRYADAHYNLGILLASQGRNSEAKVHLIETVRLRPGKEEAYNNLGIILAKEGKIDEAIVQFTEAVHLNPNYAEAYFNWGIALIRQGRNQEAIFYFNKALQINPKDAKVHNNLGVVLSNLGKTEEAIFHYSQALRINPNDANVHFNLGSLLARQGKDQEAVVQYNEALRINPHDAQVRYELGVILARQGKNEEAIVHLAEAVRIIPNYGEAHLTLGMLYLEMGKKDLALSEYRILQKINKNLANTLYEKICKYR